MAYQVYEVSAASETQLTSSPTSETQYTDARMTWGATRCYAVRSVETVDRLAVESEATPPACVTLVDTFPPAAPKELQAVATEGVINLIWDANTEADLDGYILLRGAAPGGELAPIRPELIRETAFQDRVPAGVRYIYALEAVDKAGNASPPSERIEEAAR
jgi:fibronectin type 3 domain-containing protein